MATTFIPDPRRCTYGGVARASSPLATRTGAWLVLLLLGLGSTWYCVGTARRIGATYHGATHYVAGGLDRWRTGQVSGLMRLGTMPLPVDVCTLSVYGWERWRAHPFDLESNERARASRLGDLHEVLPTARAGTLVFWWVLLVYGWLAGRHIAGPWGGALAMAFLAVEPCLLAHASLATTDLAASATLLALLYHFAVGRRGEWRRRVLVPGAWFGIALASKASALVFGPVGLAAVGVHRLWLDGRLRITRASLRPLGSDLAQVWWIGLAAVFAYCGSDFRAEPSFVAWTRGLSAGLATDGLRWIAEHLTIFSNAGEGLVQQIKHNIRGHGAYALGQTDRRALWYYFPVALAIKLSLPVLLAPGILAIVRRQTLATWPVVAAAVIFVLSVNFRVQVGVRLVLPLVVLWIVGVAGALAQWVGGLDRQRRAWGSAAVGLALALNLWASLEVYPHALCYTNPVWGGTSDGYRRLSDSNYDWGQGLPDLAQWRQGHEAHELDLWYYGSDPAVDRGPWRSIDPFERHYASDADVRAAVSGRWLAVSTTLLYGRFFREADSADPELASPLRYVRFLRAQVPAARTTTFLIFDFTRASD